MRLGRKSDIKGLRLRIGPLVGWLSRLTPTCREVAGLVSESLDRDLPLRQRLAVRAHFLICKWCERYRRQLLFLRRAVRRHPDRLDVSTSATSPALSPEARDRITARLRDHPR